MTTMTNQDCAFAIGKTHDVCEDYARAGMAGTLGDEMPYAVISDGCSGSPDTDFGARFLVAAAAECYAKFKELRPDWIIWRAANCVPPAIQTACLDATLLFASVGDDGKARGHVVGDGYVAFKMRNGDLMVYELDHGGAPGYLSYKLDADRMTRYVGQFGAHFKWRVFKNGEKLHDLEYSKFTENPEAQFFAFGYTIDEVEMVAVFSDGVASFSDAEFKPVPALDVISRLCDVKSYTGEFIKRRLKWFLTKECVKSGWIHADDVSMGAIYIPETKDEQHT